MKKIILLYLPILIGASLFLNCEQKTEPKPIEEQKFVQIYCDAVMYADLIDSRFRQAFVDSVLQSHGVTRDKFQQSVNAYSQDKKTWKKIFEKIVAELEKKEKEIIAHRDSTRAANQSINLVK